jgi:hypothetical protein
MWKLGLIFIAAGVVIIFAIFGSSAKNLFSEPITEDVPVKLKKESECVVEPSDGIPRTISNCNYTVGDILSVTYKPQQPTIESYALKNTTSS